MKNPNLSVWAFAVLFFPCLLLGRSHQPWTGFKRSGPLAKAAAGSPVLAAITKEELTGLWAQYIADSTDPEYHYFDTIETFFGGNGAFELRIHGVELETGSGISFGYGNQVIGTWSLAGGLFSTQIEACRIGEDEGEIVDCPEIESDTLPTATWQIRTIGGRKALVMPNEDDPGAEPGDTDTSIYFYVGPNRNFTLPALIPNAIRRLAGNPDLPRDREAVLLNMGSSRVFPGAGALDLRGRTVPAARLGQGYYFK